MRYPLNIHNLVTRALNNAAEMGAPIVDAGIIQEA